MKAKNNDDMSKKWVNLCNKHVWLAISGRLNSKKCLSKEKKLLKKEKKNGVSDRLVLVIDMPNHQRVIESLNPTWGKKRHQVGHSSFFGGEYW